MSSDEAAPRRRLRDPTVRLMDSTSDSISPPTNNDTFNSVSLVVPSLFVKSSSKRLSNPFLPSSLNEMHHNISSNVKSSSMENGSVISNQPVGGNLTKINPVNKTMIDSTSESVSISKSSVSVLAVTSEITLRVGEQIFTTSEETLRKTKYFTTLFNSQATGSTPDLLTNQPSHIFLDADPTVFIHTLRFLRTGVPPLFYTPKNGHDYALYAAVLAQAKFLGIPSLTKWLSEEQFLQAVKHRWYVTTYEGEKGLKKLRARTSADTSTVAAAETLWVTPSWYTVEDLSPSGYICPRGIVAHNGKQDSCGQKCRSTAVREGAAVVEEQVPQVIVVSRTLEFQGPYFGLGRAESGSGA